jgi:hypothetical protein
VNRIDYILTLDRFLINPEHISASWRYHILDKNGDTVLFVERPAYFSLNRIKNIASIAAGVAASLGVAMVLPEEIHDPYRLFLLLAVFLVVLIPTSLALSIRYRTTLFRDESKREIYLEIFQDNRIPFPFSWYTVKDGSGRTLGRIRRSYYHKLVLKRWHLYGEDGLILGIAKEDSTVKSVLSRVIGSPIPLLITNYTLFDGKMGNILGEFNRRQLVFGCYVLDMDSDYRRTIDRRIALALGVMLDAGEKA